MSNVYTSDRRIEGMKDRKIEGSKERRIEGSKDRWIERSKDRKNEGSKDRRIEGTKDRRIEICGQISAPPTSPSLLGYEMSTLTIHCRWEDYAARERTSHPTSYADAKKMMTLTHHTSSSSHRLSLRGLRFFFLILYIFAT
jgi:hypothetical protein